METHETSKSEKTLAHADETEQVITHGMNVNEEPFGLVKADLPLTLLTRDDENDVFDAGEYNIWVVTDRANIFGVPLPQGIPEKGRYSARISSYWLKKTQYTLLNTFVALIDDISDLDEYISPDQRFEYPEYMAGRTLVFKKLETMPCECETWGFLTSAIWQEYKNQGTVFGHPVIKGLLESQSIPGNILTVFRQAEDGTREQLSDSELIELAGQKAAPDILKKSVEVFDLAQRYARIPAGFYIANVRMQFSLQRHRPVIVNPILTPSSSCYWDMKTYRIGQTNYGFDLQALKVWLLQSGWVKTRALPEIPYELIQQASERYLQICQRITGAK